MNLALCGIEPRIPRLQFMLSYQWATSADGHYYFRHNIFCNFPTFKMKRKITLKKWKCLKIRFLPELKDLEIFDFCYVLPQSSGDADFSVRIMIRTINMAPDQVPDGFLRMTEVGHTKFSGKKRNFLNGLIPPKMMFFEFYFLMYFCVLTLNFSILCHFRHIELAARSARDLLTVLESIWLSSKNFTVCNFWTDWADFTVFYWDSNPGPSAW